MTQKKRKAVKPKVVMAWAHMNAAGKITWVGTPDMPRSHARICLYDGERVVRVRIEVLP